MAAQALHGAVGALAATGLPLAASAAAGTGARLPKEGPQGSLSSGYGCPEGSHREDGVICLVALTQK